MGHIKRGILIDLWNLWSARIQGVRQSSLTFGLSTLYWSLHQWNVSPYVNSLVSQAFSWTVFLSCEWEVEVRTLVLFHNLPGIHHSCNESQESAVSVGNWRWLHLMKCSSVRHRIVEPNTFILCMMNSDHTSHYHAITAEDPLSIIPWEDHHSLNLPNDLG